MIGRPPRSTLLPTPPLFRSPAVRHRWTGRLERIANGCGARRFAGAATRASEPPCATWQTQSKSALGLAKRLAKLYGVRSEEHTSELQSQSNIGCRLLLEKKK